MSLPWTDERVETLKKLWLAGFSASQIANELGGVSRNAVIGKVHRLKIEGRPKSTPPSAPKPRKAPIQRPPGQAIRTAVRGNTALAVAAPMTQLQPAILAVPEEVVIPFSQRVSIMELRESMCKWPMGDPQEADFRYCGARKEEISRAYCTYHAARAYQPVNDRRRERRVE